MPTSTVYITFYSLGGLAVYLRVQYPQGNKTKNIAVANSPIVLLTVRLDRF